MQKTKRRSVWFLMVLFIAVLLAGCGGGSSGGGSGGDDLISDGDDTTPTDDDDGDTTEQAAFPGYDFALADGAFWEFGFDEYRRSWYLGDSSTSTDAGIFRIVLGTPIVIDGISAYPLSIIQVSGDDINETLTLRWRYIAFDEGRILGSTDGSTLSVIFDAFHGSQAGGGFFSSFASDELVTAATGQIDNDYLTGAAEVLSKAASSGGCEYFPGVGTICPAEDREGLRVRDYFQAGIGPVGYYYYAYNTDSQGDSGALIEVNIGLLEYSAEGDGLYDPPDVPALSSGTLVVYYSLYDNPPTLVNDLYNAPTPIQRPGVLMRYLPVSQTSTALTPVLPATADYGYHALTEGDRLFLMKRQGSDDDLQLVEYDPANHSPLAGTTAVVTNSSDYPIHYGALTTAGDSLYYQTYSMAANLDPWSDNIPFYGQSLGSLSRTTLATSAGYNHIMHDGAGGESPFAAFILDDAGSLCPSGNYLYYFQRLDISGGISPVDLGGACETSDFFTDLSSLVHSFAIDEAGMYIARSYGDNLDLYRIDRNSQEITELYADEEIGSQRSLLIDASNGYLLLHILDHVNSENSAVLLLNTQNTSTATDDTLQTLDLPGTGIPMNLQLLVVP